MGSPRFISQRPRKALSVNATTRSLPQAGRQAQLNDHDHEHHKPQRPTSETSSNGSYHNPVERETEQGTAFRLALVSVLSLRANIRSHVLLPARSRQPLGPVRLLGPFWRDCQCTVRLRPRTGVIEPVLWRFTHISDEQQGMDPTATIASKVQVALFENVVAQFLDSMRAESTAGAFTRYLHGAEDTLDSSGSYPTWKIHVINEASRKRSELIVRRPFAGHSSPFGRATRAYIACDLRERRLIFMKDAWRIDNPKLRPEFNTYQSLQHHGIPHIPTVFYGGDVRGSDGEVQKTSAPSVGAGQG